ncbi:peptidylprolyl isomerase [Antarcticimicrobium sediminis]|uniref:Parvulin-like PPIase n=1 Tax=Antarcticimicrobium sediminis TaxID=2546227 RepID=A0A4R5ESZ2_9RHOB|nr:peptidylprolyl isomerase [Antarcticimicrobium sediminis]TDE37894.1 peptidase [Antarcticimicrobium sediminis]
MTNPLFPEITINGTTLSAADIAAEAQNHPAPAGKPGLAWRRAARALVIRQVLLDEAERLGLTPPPEELSPDKWETPEEAQIRELLAQNVQPAPVSEEALHQIYQRNPGAYRAPSLYQPAHILFAAAPEDKKVRAAAKLRGEAVLKDLRATPGQFATLVRKESACSSRDTDGQLGQLSSGDTVPEFEAAMDAAPVGAIYETLVETRYGYHILRVDERATGEILPFDAVRPRLSEACEKANWARAANAYLSGLLDRTEITGIDLAAVA